MFDYALVALGGAIGSVARFWFAAFMVRVTGPTFPWGTLIINVFGSFVIGLLAGGTHPDAWFHVPHHWAVFTMTGICGGFTTFSSFSLQTFDLFKGKQKLESVGYVLASMVFCLLGVALGAAVYGMKI